MLIYSNTACQVQHTQRRVPHPLLATCDEGVRVGLEGVPTLPRYRRVKGPARRFETRQ